MLSQGKVDDLRWQALGALPQIFLRQQKKSVDYKSLEYHGKIRI